MRGRPATKAAPSVFHSACKDGQHAHGVRCPSGWTLKRLESPEPWPLPDSAELRDILDKSAGSGVLGIQEAVALMRVSDAEHLALLLHGGSGQTESLRRPHRAFRAAAVSNYCGSECLLRQPPRQYGRGRRVHDSAGNARSRTQADPPGTQAGFWSAASCPMRTWNISKKPSACCTPSLTAWARSRGSTSMWAAEA